MNSKTKRDYYKKINFTMDPYGYRKTFTSIDYVYGFQFSAVLSFMISLSDRAKGKSFKASYTFVERFVPLGTTSISRQLKKMKELNILTAVKSDWNINTYLLNLEALESVVKDASKEFTKRIEILEEKNDKKIEKRISKINELNPEKAEMSRKFKEKLSAKKTEGKKARPPRGRTKSRQEVTGSTPKRSQVRPPKEPIYNISYNLSRYNTNNKPLNSARSPSGILVHISREDELDIIGVDGDVVFRDNIKYIKKKKKLIKYVKGNSEKIPSYIFHKSFENRMLKIPYLFMLAGKYAGLNVKGLVDLAVTSSNYVLISGMIDTMEKNMVNDKFLDKFIFDREVKQQQKDNPSGDIQMEEEDFNTTELD